MADRYWVGGTAAWDGTAGTKWALTSGGAGGQAVPTSADDVFFDAASGAVTCTISAGNTGAKSINCTGFTGTLNHNANITVAGSFTLVAGMNFTAASSSFTFVIFSGTGTLTTAGKQFSTISVNGVGITITLGDAYNGSDKIISITSGTFDTGNYNVTAGALNSSNSNTRTITLGSSAITLSNAAGAIEFSNAVGLTFNSGTSQINLTNVNADIAGGNRTFYNVSFTSTSAGFRTIRYSNVFNNLAITAPSAAGVTQVTFDSPQTINGTLSTTNTAGNRRVWFRSIYGIAQTLTVNSTPSLIDADFRDIYVIGTAAPVGGTRIGDLRGCSGITFSTPKTVYWNLPAGGNWSATAWAASSGGGVSTDNFPLAQDTAVIENTGLNTSATVTMDAAITYAGSLNLLNRTNAMTLSTGAYVIYGDWANGSGVSIGLNRIITLSGRNTQTITSAGKFGPTTFVIDSYGGTVELADALTIGSNTLTVTNGTFDTKNYAVTVGTLSSSNSNVRGINLGSSTVTLSATGTALSLATSTNLAFNAGTSQITMSSGASDITVSSGGLVFYNVSFTGTGAFLRNIIGVNTFNNLTVAAPASAGLMGLQFVNNQTINGTLTVSGATPTRRIFVRSDTLGTPRTLTVGTLSANDCDFRDITISGAAAGSTPTRAGDCGGNSGIVFPVAKTVYWNLAGTQNWSATAWADVSGGTPAVNNFPLAQDVAVFDNAGAAGTVTIDQAWAIGTFDASARTTALNFNTGNCNIYGDWTSGTGLTISGSSLLFCKRGTQTITSNGVTFGNQLRFDTFVGTVKLTDALTLTSVFLLFSGTFDADVYNVTAGTVLLSGTAPMTLKMGSGTWTISGNSSTVWNYSYTNLTFYKGTANIVLSDTGTTPRVFAGGGLSYNKLTIGGTTGTSTLTITGNNQFTELASTKTVAHTIDFGSTTQTFGKWTVSGTLGNAVTVNGSGTAHVIAGSRVSGVDYLVMGTIGFSSASPGEFYAGANSTGSNASIIKTAAPAATTRYWVGGTGTWDAASTTKWSDTSGGSGGASVPTSADAVVFDAASNATAYTVTCTGTGLRCGSLTFAAPASGNVTWAGTAPIAIHDLAGGFVLPVTGLTRTYTGPITLSGSNIGKTFNTNGVVLSSSINVNGVLCQWILQSALNIGNNSSITVINGTFITNNYNIVASGILSSTYGQSLTNDNSRSIDFSNSTVNLSFSSPLSFGGVNLNFNAGTSQINCSSNGPTFNGNGLTFYNVSFTSTNAGVITLNGANTFNNLSFSGIGSVALNQITFAANQTVNATLTFSAGTNATMRHFVRSDAIGATRTLTCAAFSGTDADFRDIIIAGAAAPISGTRLGDCKGNSGITFDAPKTVYWNLAGNNNWSATAWATSDGGTPAANNFPLAQDTAVFTATSPASAATTTINAAYNIGTIDMSARTTNTMTLATGSNNPTIYGNWINGTGTTLTGTGAITFAGRNTQAITSAGKTFTQVFTINSPSGFVTLQDAFTINPNGISFLESGTFDANGFNVTFSGNNGIFQSISTRARTIAVGSGTWVLAGSSSNPWANTNVANLTVTGTGTVSLTSASAKTFAGGSVSYAGITLNQGGSGSLTITGNNTFADITNTYSTTAATTIALGNTTQRVGKFTASGAAGKVLTVTGTSASSPATLIYTGAGEATAPTTDYLNVVGVRAYNLANTWKAGANSVNAGSLGWIFAAGTVVATLASTFFLLF